MEKAQPFTHTRTLIRVFFRYRLAAHSETKQSQRITLIRSNQMKRLCTASVMDKLDLKSKTSIRARVKSGLLPKPFRDPGSNVNYWLEESIDKILQEQAAQAAATQEQQAAA